MEEFEGVAKSEGVNRVLDMIEVFPNKLPDQYKSIIKPIVAPGARLGISSATGVAEQINAIMMFRSYIDMKPPYLQGAVDLMFDVVVAAVEPVVNATKDGRLLQVVTGQRVEPDIPPWVTSVAMQQEQLERYYEQLKSVQRAKSEEAEEE